MNNANLEHEIDNIYDLITNAIKDQNHSLIQEGQSSIELIEKKFEHVYHLKKKYGAFYTNQEICSFIFSKSLILYLKKQIPGLNINILDDILTLKQNVKENVCNKLLNVKICDPACGLGAFILSALEILFQLIPKLNSHLKRKNLIHILFKNLFGFEINQSALKICRIKLYYWAIHNKSLEIIEEYNTISSNVSLMNSLFDLNNQKFDIVIGNPPYGNIMDESEKKVLKKQGIYYNDIYCAFVLKSLQWSEGIISFLVPKSFLLRQSYIAFRHQLLSKANLLEIYDLGPNLFKQATNEVQILIFENKLEYLPPLFIYSYPDEKVISYPKQEFDNLRICLNTNCSLSSKVQKIHVYTFSSTCPYCKAITSKLNRIRIKFTNITKEIVEKIEKVADLNLLNIRDYPKMIRGEEASGLKEVRKKIKFDGKGSCNFIYAKDDFQYYYYIKNKSFDLDKLDSNLMKGKNFEYYIHPKLLIKHNNIFPQAMYSEDCLCFTSSIYSLLDDNVENLKYLCGLLNSSIIQFYCLYAINNQQNTTINLNQYMIRHLPLKNASNDDKKAIIRNVDLILEAFKNTKGRIDKTIAKFWREIDDHIFQMYTLSTEHKNYILTSLQNENEFIKIIYSIEIK